MLYQPPKNIEDYILSKKGAEKSFPFGEEAAVYKVKNKMFALIGKMGLNLKCDPDEAILWRSMYDGITPAYHMNKEHWNSITLDASIPKDSVPEDLVQKMIDDSYDLVVKKLSKKDRATLLGGFK